MTIRMVELLGRVEVVSVVVRHSAKGLAGKSACFGHQNTLVDDSG
jgi:hypothetical protein